MSNIDFLTVYLNPRESKEYSGNDILPTTYLHWNCNFTLNIFRSATLYLQNLNKNGPGLMSMHDDDFSNFFRVCPCYFRCQK